MSDHLFKKGNKFGGRKPKGSKHQRTVILDALKAQSSSEQEFAEMLIDRAREGCSTSITVLSNRMWKQTKQNYDPFTLPERETREDQAEAITAAMMTGQISADQAAAAISVLRGTSELTDIAELLRIIKELEK